MSARRLAVFDLDGTLSDTRHRLHLIEQPQKRWDLFFQEANKDAPLEEGVRLALERAGECEIAYLTGRPERCRRDTLAWLERHGLPRGRLWMRAGGDRRPARVTKLEVLRRLGHTRVIDVVVDDDELVCDAVEGAGYRVIRARWMGLLPPALHQAQEQEGQT